MTFKMKYLLIINTLLFSTNVLFGAEFAGLPLKSGTYFKGLRIPLGESFSKNSDVIISIDEVTLVQKKFDFLQTALIPEALIKGITFKVNKGEGQGNWPLLISDFCDKNPLFKQARFEKITFLLPVGNAATLMAECGNIERSGGAFRLKGVVLCDGIGGINIAQARLQLKGESMGVLTWNDPNGHHTIPLACPMSGDDRKTSLTPIM